VKSHLRGSRGGTGKLGALLLTIWALPGIGIPTLLILLQTRKSSSLVARRDTPTAKTTVPNERGQYG
jgi:hypothetical protein